MDTDPQIDEASAIISLLPTQQKANDWRDYVDIRSNSDRHRWELACDRLTELHAAGSERAQAIVGHWTADTFAALGQIESAIEWSAIPDLGQRGSTQTDRRLSLKHSVGQHVTGHEVATLFGPKLTKFGKDNLAAISTYLDIRVRMIEEQERRNLLAEWSGDAFSIPQGTSLYAGHPSYIYVSQPIGRSFSLSPTAALVCIDLLRDAENTYREERGIPRVGEGWVAETALYYAVKAAFPNDDVRQHGRPTWLGRQHLDVYLAKRKVALEYQGAQHDRPVAFFGGEEAYLRNVERDRMKAGKCTANGVAIIYVREGYDLGAVIGEIISSSS